MTDDAALAALLERAGFPGARPAPLAGDASTRRYLRVSLDGRSAVLVVHGHSLPDAAAGPTDPFPFERWRRFYETLGLRVPALLAEDRPAGLLLLEDLGDELLQQRVAARGPRSCALLYHRAVALGRRLAEAGTPRFSPDAADSDDPLTPRRLGVEMDFLLRHGAGADDGALAGATGALADAHALLHALCEAVHEPPDAAGRTLVLCHRDYHARNLLVLPDGSLAVVDFQDTRRGPRSYDLASLAHDPYVDLPDDLVSALVEAWRPEATPRESWRVEVDLAAAQRLLKAAGSYAWLSGARGLPRYRRWLPVALQRARQRLQAARWPEAAALESALAAVGLGSRA
jgi:hypothetical protein